MNSPDPFRGKKLNFRGLIPSGLELWVLVLALFASLGMAGCVSGSSTGSTSGQGSAPTITSFTANPASIASGSSSTLSWVAAGATSIAIAPGTFTSTSASGSTAVSPTATTTYTLTASNAAGSVTSTAIVTVTAPSKPTITFLHGQSRKHRFRFQQHAELGCGRGHEYRHRAGNVYIHIGERVNYGKPNGDNNLYADGEQCRRLGHVHGDCHSDRAEQANHHVLHGQSRKHRFRFQQHAELGCGRGHEYRHRAGNVYIHIGERVTWGKPDGDYHLHADCDQRRRLGHLHGKGQCNHVRRCIEDNDYFVPRGNATRGVCGLHDRRHRRYAALHLFAQRGCHRLSSVA